MKIMMPNPSQEYPASYKASNQDLEEWMFFAPTKLRYKAKIWRIDILKIIDHIIKSRSQTSQIGCIKDKCPYPNQN